MNRPACRFLRPNAVAKRGDPLSSKANWLLLSWENNVVKTSSYSLPVIAAASPAAPSVRGLGSSHDA
jgi:hypothetical protein